MTASALPAQSPSRSLLAGALALTGCAWLVLFAQPLTNTVSLWWSNPEAGHGLLLVPIALWLAWRKGVRPAASANVAAGLVMIACAVALRYLSAIAAEVFVGRAAMFLAAAGIVVWAWGFRQLLWWWLPMMLLVLSVPLPELILSSLALPLQLQASRFGAALMVMRDIPVTLSGNVIRLPGHELFVTEACSGLRSLTALLALGILLGGVMLRHPLSRIALVIITIPIGVIINGVRVFFTGYLVAYVDPKLAEGFNHLTEGWLLFLVAFAILGLFTWGAVAIERRVLPQPSHA
jgi:exosortase